MQDNITTENTGVNNPTDDNQENLPDKNISRKQSLRN